MRNDFIFKIAGLSVGVFFEKASYPVVLLAIKKDYTGFLSKDKPVLNVEFNGRDNKYDFANLLRRTYSALLPKKHGFLLHASGVISKNKGYIFTGKSGAGKTTAAEATKRVKAGTVLSDEIVALRREDGVWYLYGTPFMGLMKGGGKPGRCAKLKVFFLKQAKKNSVRDIPLEKAWAKLLRNCILYVPDKRAVNLTFDLLRKTPYFELEFKKTGFWEELWRLK